MTTQKKYIYDVKSSSLFDIGGHLIKRVFCPKAKHWNQLIADDPLDRTRGCPDCEERVVNLDKDRIGIITEADGPPCIYISAESTSVIFLEDKNELPEVGNVNADRQGVVVIKTARTIEDINRAANMGYWPDVRIVQYKDREVATNPALNVDQKAKSATIPFAVKPIRSKFSIDQNMQTGQIQLTVDFRNAERDERFERLIPFTFYYPHYQPIPVAAYLIPPGLQEGTEVVVEDPIEDLVLRLWNQGDIMRANNVRGCVRAKKVELDYQSVKPRRVMG